MLANNHLIRHGGDVLQFLTSQVRLKIDQLLALPQPAGRTNNHLGLDPQLLVILGLLVAVDLRPLRLRQEENGHEVFTLRSSDRPDALEAVLPEDAGRAALDEGDAREVQQVGLGAGFEPVAHVLQHAAEHAPAHARAELDHAGRKPFARLREVLHEAAGGVVLAGDGVDGELVAEVAELEGGVGASVDAGGVLFLRRGFR